MGRYAGLLVLTDMNLGVARKGCQGGMGRSECLLPGCYSLLERCDGKFDCDDRVDERGCEYHLVKCVLCVFW